MRCNLLLGCVLFLIAMGSNSSVGTLRFAVPVVTGHTVFADLASRAQECHDMTVEGGDVLHSLLKQRGIDVGVTDALRSASKKLAASLPKKQAHQVLRLPDFLYSGDRITFCYTDSSNSGVSANSSELLSMKYSKKDADISYLYTKQKDGFIVLPIKKTVVKRIETVSFSVQTSLYADALKAGLSDRDIMTFADIFQWDINFLTGVRVGDRVSIMLEYLYENGAKTGNNKILIAEYRTLNKHHIAYRYERNGNLVGYFDAKGKAKGRRFLRWPLNFTRISSGFNPRRLHPIFKKIRPHRGVDYAAPRHTKVYAVSHGKVIKAGWGRGYGRHIVIDHGNGYTTLYAHLQKIPSSVQVRSKIQRGQLIGYVGSSGWATGPHLHYEFRVNGVHKNPVTVTLPRRSPIKKRYRKDFMNHINQIQHEYVMRVQALAFNNTQ